MKWIRSECSSSSRSARIKTKATQNAQGMAARAWVKAEALSRNGSPEPWGSCQIVTWRCGDAIGLRWDSWGRRPPDSMRGRFPSTSRPSRGLRQSSWWGAWHRRRRARPGQKTQGAPPRVTPARTAACSMTSGVNQGVNARKSRSRILSHTSCLVGSTNIGEPSLISCFSLNNLCQGVLLDFNQTYRHWAVPTLRSLSGGCKMLPIWSVPFFPCRP